MNNFTALWMGVPWMTFWMKTWTRMLDPYAASALQYRSSRSTNPDDRRQELPWLPQIESTVIPFRRRDDEPGTEGTKVSMRMRVPNLPWMVGSNVIAIDTVMPRPIGDVDDEDAPASRNR